MTVYRANSSTSWRFRAQDQIFSICGKLIGNLTWKEEKYLRYFSGDLLHFCELFSETEGSQDTFTAREVLRCCPSLGSWELTSSSAEHPLGLGQSDLRVNGKSNPVLDCIISPLGLKICKRGGMMNLMSFLSPWVSLPGHMTWSISLQLQSSSHCCGCNGNSFCVADPARLLSTFTYRRKGEG